MHTVELKPLVHRSLECIGIYSPLSSELNYHFEKKAGAKWSQHNKCWYVPCTEKNYEQLASTLRGIAILNTAPLKEYLLKRKLLPKQVLEAKAQQTNNAGFATDTSPEQVNSILKKSYRNQNLSDENSGALQKFGQLLILKSYSRNTIRTYTNEFLQFLQLIKDNRAQDFTPDRLKDYLQYCHDHLKLSENTLHSRMNALKFYYEQVLYREKFFWQIPRPKRPMILPKLLNENELKKLFNALQNKKHKAMLFTAYSAGLRVSEIVNLKISHIDSERMQIFIERAKGKKDRYVNLSPLVLDILRKYLQDYKPVPKYWLFESEQTRSSYPIRTVQQIFSNAKHKAGIRKEVGIHSLRHSFATHLLDKGTDIKYIKDLLGHFNIKTTERYLHVSKQQLVNILSPFDDLYKDEKIDW
ncbi:MAG: tyrosine-type recombinase/integrase [Ginsengibacter sp.]